MALDDISNRWQADEKRWSSWMAASHLGDKQAYGQLLSELTNVLTVYLSAQFGQFELLEDCVQECLLAIHKARHTYDPKRAFRPWLFTIARHKTIDMLRQSNRHINKGDELGQVEPEEVTMASVQRMMDGAKLLIGLSDDHREVLMLTKYVGLTTLEAANSLGISESAVKARLRRSLQIVQKSWEAESIYL